MTVMLSFSQCARQCVRQSVRPCARLPFSRQPSRRFISRPSSSHVVINFRGVNCLLGRLQGVHFKMATGESSARPLASHTGTSFTDPDVVEFLDKAYELIKTVGLQKGTDRSTTVVNFEQPEDLEKLLDLEISAEPASHETLLAEMKKVLHYSVKTGHPYFFNQLYAGLDPYSQTGSWLTETVNTNIHTYEASPVFIVMEKYMLSKICNIIGYENGDGLFCPGGSASNIMALHLARFRKFPNVKADGMYGLPKMRVYVSVDGHYSMKKGAPYLGMGMSNVVTIATDAKGKVIIEDFENKIKEDIEKGYAPLMMMATSGSTVLGTFDPLVELSEVCQKYGIWLHVDACWGGGVLLSKKYRYLCEGIDKCDSVAWNFHKFTGCPVQTSVLLLKQKDLLFEANNYRAEYLFQPDKCYDNKYDIGDKSVQCGRKVDVMKLWLQWKAMGDSGFESLVDKAYDNARYFKDKLIGREGFKLVLPEFECTNICFWYIPPSLRGKEETAEWWAEIGKVGPKIKEKMVKEGTVMIAYNPLSSKGLVNFFRIIIHNPLLDYKDMDFAIEEIERLGKDL